jgi:hypothetical protein
MKNRNYTYIVAVTLYILTPVLFTVLCLSVFGITRQSIILALMGGVATSIAGLAVYDEHH